MIHMTQKTACCFIGVAALLLLGCENQNDTESNRYPFPNIQSFGSCSDPGSEQSFCSAIDMVDEIAYGEVLEVSPNTLPAAKVNSLGETEIVGDCHAPIKIGLRIKLQVEYSLSNSTMGFVEVLIGPSQLDKYSPMPLMNSDGELVWYGVSVDNGGIIEVGRKIGFLLHRVAIESREYWTILGEPMFFVDDNGKVRVQVYERSCSTHGLTSVDGIGFVELKSEALACGGANGFGGDGYDISWWMPLCLEDEGDVLGCSTSDDCGAGLVCRDGVCE